MPELSKKKDEKWKNKLYIADNLDVLNGLNSESVDLVYLDPPFNSNRIYGSTLERNTTVFSDIWNWKDIDEYKLDIIANDFPELADYIEIIDRVSDIHMKSYIVYMAQRVIQLKRILKPTGSIYYHCDPTAGHFVKLMLDGIFGKNNFRNEIKWTYNTYLGKVDTLKYFPRKTDLIYFYSKNYKDYYFNKVPFGENFQDTVDGKRWKKYLTEEGTILEGNHPKTDIRFKAYRDKWIRENGRKPQKGEVIYSCKGTIITDCWTDLKAVDPKSKENTGQLTQKPLALLERIIKASCPEDGVVLDPFCGCATTCVAAQRLKRKWIGIDICDLAMDLLTHRLEQDGYFKDQNVKDLDMKIKEQGEDFIILNCIDKKSKNYAPLPRRTDVEEQNLNEPKTKKAIKEVLYQQQEHKCNGCGRVLDIDLLEIDHIVPKSHGGGDYMENYQLLCGSCNKIKGAKPMEFLLQRVELIRRERRKREY